MTAWQKLFRKKKKNHCRHKTQVVVFFVIIICSSLRQTWRVINSNDLYKICWYKVWCQCSIIQNCKCSVSDLHSPCQRTKQIFDIYTLLHYDTNAPLRAFTHHIINKHHHTLIIRCAVIIILWHLRPRFATSVSQDPRPLSQCLYLSLHY